MCLVSAATTVVVSLPAILTSIVKRVLPLDEGGNVRVIRAGKKVSFPMARHGTILNLGGPFADGDYPEYLPLSPSSRCGSWGDASAAQYATAPSAPS